MVTLNQLKSYIFSFKMSRAAQFKLNTQASEEFKERRVDHSFLDKLMEEIPGKNNYRGYLEDTGYDANILNVDDDAKKDVSKYHRWFKLSDTDANGNQVITFSFYLVGTQTSLTIVNL